MTKPRHRRIASPQALEILKAVGAYNREIAIVYTVLLNFSKGENTEAARLFAATGAESHISNLNKLRRMKCLKLERVNPASSKAGTRVMLNDVLMDAYTYEGAIEP